MKSNARRIWVLSLLVWSGLSSGSQSEMDPAADSAEGSVRLAFVDAPLDLVLQTYEQLTGRVLLRAPNLAASITLNTRTRLPREETQAAIESMLALNGISIVPMGERFAKVVPTAMARHEGLPIDIGRPLLSLFETDAPVSRVIRLENIPVAEAVPILQKLIRGTGQIQPIDRTNSLMITDTSVNLRRILELLEYMDRPAVFRVETRVYELRHAEAAQVAQRLNELIADAQAQDAQARRAAPARIQPEPPAPPDAIPPAPPGAAADPEIELAERGVVTGPVKIVPDERTNVMIIISPPANFIFFDHIIAVLDRPTDPEVSVRVYALDYADAEEVAGLLNQFVGSAAAADSPADRPPAGDPAAGGDERGQILREFIARQAEARASAEPEGDAGIGSISPQTRILADKRSNALLIMGRRRDVNALVEVVEKLDVMLAQVMIEAVILEITLSDSLHYGLDWLQRSIAMYPAGSGGPAAGATPSVAFGGGFAAADAPRFRDGMAIDRNVPLSTAGMTYYLTLFNLNLDAVLRLAAQSGDARVLSTPVILTTHNTEASIISSEQRPVVTQTTTIGGEIRSSYEYRDIGIKLTVKPRINPARHVLLDITQTADTPGEEVRIDHNLVPRIFRRELKAQIAVPHRGTIALGGLIQTDQKQTRNLIPILGDIPLIGWLFRGQDRSMARTELLVLITPYVITTPEEARKETLRLHDRSSVSGTEWYRTWPDGDLAVEKRDSNADRIPLRGRGGARPVAPAPDPTPAEEAPDGAVGVESELQLMPWVREALEEAE